MPIAFDEATRLETMEAASRPVFEPLTDLPVEAPIDGRVSVGATPASSASPIAPASRKARPLDSTTELIDPESLLTGSDSDPSFAALNEGPAAGPAASNTSGTAPAGASSTPDSEDLL